MAGQWEDYNQFLADPPDPPTSVIATSGTISNHHEEKRLQIVVFSQEL